MLPNWEWLFFLRSFPTRQDGEHAADYADKHDTIWRDYSMQNVVFISSGVQVWEIWTGLSQ